MAWQGLPVDIYQEQAAVSIRTTTVATCYTLSNLSAVFFSFFFAASPAAVRIHFFSLLSVCACVRTFYSGILSAFIPRRLEHPAQGVHRKHGAARLLLQKFQRTMGNPKVRTREETQPHERTSAS